MLIDLIASFASSPSPHVLLDRDLRMIWANEAYLAVTGRSRDQVIGRILTEEFSAPPDSTADRMLRASFRREFETGVTDHLPLIPYPITAPDGTAESRYWSATHTPLFDAEGAVEYILQNTNDVTPLYLSGTDATSAKPEDHATMIRRAETVTRRNLELGSLADFIRTIFDQAPSFIAILSGPEHVLQLVNRAYVEVVGRANMVGSADLLGQPVRQAMPDIAGHGIL